MTVTEPLTEAGSGQARRPAAPTRLVDHTRYSSAEFAAREMASMWTRVWQLACREDEVPNVGDHYEYEIGPYSILVIRSGPDTLVAHHNVCLHRGRKIKTGCGSSAQLRCPYHGWTWTLQGQLSDVPEREAFAPFDDADYGLRSVKVDTWAGWVFVNLDCDAEPLIDYLGEIATMLEPYGIEHQNRWRAQSTVVRGNWKNSVDAFNEAYHARTIHPESVNYTNFHDYEVRLLGRHSMMIVPTGEPDPLAVPGTPDVDETLDAMKWAYDSFGEDSSMFDLLRGMELEEGQTLRDVLKEVARAGLELMGVDVSQLSDARIIDDWHFFIFPNVVLNVFGHGYFLFRIRPVQGDPSRCIFDIWLHHKVANDADVPPPVPVDIIPEGHTCGAVMDQDFDNVAIQQRGQANPVLPGLTLSSLETRITHMHDVIDEYLDQRR